MRTLLDREGGTRRLVVAMLVAVVFGFVVARFDGVLSLVIPTIMGTFGLLLLVRMLGDGTDDSESQARVLRWTMVAFVAHLALGLAIYYGGTALRSYLVGDAAGYHRYAIELTRHWTEGLPIPELASGKEGFYYLLAGLYWVFGAHAAAGLAVNATLAAALVPLTTDSTRRLVGPAAARYAAPLVVLLPGLMFFSSQLLKEAPIMFLVAVAANCALRLLERISLSALVVLAVTLSVLFTFRAPVALVLGGGLVIAVALGGRQLLSGLSVGLSTLALIAILVLSLGVGRSGYNAAVNADLQRANEMRRDAAEADSGYGGSDVDISTSQRAISELPIALVRFFLGPFPWQLQGPRQLPGVLDALAWWWLLPSLWRGTRATMRMRGRRILVVIMPAVATTIVLALAVGNFGTLVRERLQVFILLVPLVALGLAMRSAARSQPRERPAELVPALPSS